MDNNSPELRIVSIDNFEKLVTSQLFYKYFQKYNIKSIFMDKDRSVHI
jgi:hypothetical protein